MKHQVFAICHPETRVVHWIGATADGQQYLRYVPAEVRARVTESPVIEVVYETDGLGDRGRVVNIFKNRDIIGRRFDPALFRDTGDQRGRRWRMPAQPTTAPIEFRLNGRDDVANWHFRPAANDQKPPPLFPGAQPWTRQPKQIPLPDEPYVPEESVRVAVPHAALIDAIRLRSFLVPWAEIAQWLNERHANGHRWTPGEVKHVVASSFYALGPDPTYANPPR